MPAQQPGLRLRRRTPSPALVIALIALFVAMSGTAYSAAKINGKDIKARTITAKQIKNGAITGKQIKSATIQKKHLAKGLSVQGPAGAQGPAGPQGAPGQNGVNNVVVRRITETGLNPGQNGSGLAVCAAGQTLVSGGAYWVDPDSNSIYTGGNTIISSGPTPAKAMSDLIPATSGEATAGWFAAGENNSSKTLDFATYALCSQP